MLLLSIYSRWMNQVDREPVLYIFFTTGESQAVPLSNGYNDCSCKKTAVTSLAMLIGQRLHGTDSIGNIPWRRHVSPRKCHTLKSQLIHILYISYKNKNKCCKTNPLIRAVRIVYDFLNLDKVYLKMAWSQYICLSLCPAWPSSQVVLLWRLLSNKSHFGRFFISNSKRNCMAREPVSPSISHPLTGASTSPDSRRTKWGRGMATPARAL